MTRHGKTNSHGSNTRTPLQELHALAFSRAGSAAEEIPNDFGPYCGYGRGVPITSLL